MIATRSASVFVALALSGIIAAVPTMRSSAKGTFVNKGLVGFGLIASNATDAVGDTIGGIGSAIAIQRGTFNAKKDGTFTGTLVVQPDRGYNVINTVDYQARHHFIDFVLTPYYNASNMSFKEGQATLALKYQSTLLYTDSNKTPTTGLDSLSIRPAANGEPQLPIPSLQYNHISIDAEGLVLNCDGTFWTSDEYGPYIYQFSPSGVLLQTLVPPQAILPYQNGTLNFTSAINPTTGRTANQGLEGLTASPDGSTLYALMQSATIQDGGSSKTTNRYTRLLAYSISKKGNAKLTGEWVVPLPQSSKGKTFAPSELHYLSDTSFLILSRDGNGSGSDTPLSVYKQIDLVDISKATDIHGTKYDTATTAVAPGGVLAKGVTPATYTSFVNMLDATQLARFGLQNGGASDETLIDAKWESLALAPVGDKKYPDDYFLFTAADNDFQTTQGMMVGHPYNASIDENTQFLVYRVTLPTVASGSIEKALGI